MPAQSQESKRAGMEAFLDIFEEFDRCIDARVGAGYGHDRDRIALFAAYISRMER